MIWAADVDVIYPYKELLKENSIEPVFYKTDSHWTQTGAFIGYKELLKKIKKYYPNINVLNKNDFNLSYSKQVNFGSGINYSNGIMYKNSGISDFILKNNLDINYLYYEHPYKKNFLEPNILKISDFNKKTDAYYYFPNGYNKKIMIIGDSFILALLNFLPYTFEQTLSCVDHNRRFSFNEYEKMIKEYKPDIIVITMRTFYIPNLLNLYKTEESK